jgi:hypothetical protein
MLGQFFAQVGEGDLMHHAYYALGGVSLTAQPVWFSVALLGPMQACSECRLGRSRT